MATKTATDKRITLTAAQRTAIEDALMAEPPYIRPIERSIGRI